MTWMTCACVSACSPGSSGGESNSAEGSGDNDGTIGSDATGTSQGTGGSNEGSTAGVDSTGGVDTGVVPPACDTPPDSALSLQWDWARDGAGTQDGAGALAIDATGNLYVTWSQGTDSLDSISWLTVFAPDGSVLWELTPFVPTRTLVKGLAFAADGTLRAAGTAFIDDPMFGLTSEIFVAAYDPDGALLWSDDTPTHPPNPFTQANTLAVAPDGSVVVAGMGGNAEGFFRRYDAGGAAAWTVIAPTSPIAIALDASGDFFVAGTDDASDAIIERRDGAGTVVWTAAGPGPGQMDYDAGAALLVAVAPDGAVVAAGLDAYLIGNPMMPTDAWSTLWIRQLDGDGGEVWTTTFDHTDYMQMALAIDTAGDPTLVHRTMDGPPYVRRLDAVGALQWELVLPCPHDGLSVAMSSDQGLYFAGNVDGGAGQDAYVALFAD